MNLVATTLFLLSAFVLLGTPGPGIAVILIVDADRPWRTALPATAVGE
jgi:threonine/homoserine/homoserine lactone efflux protein